MGTVGDLDAALKAAGIPIVGVVLCRRGPPVEAYIQFPPEATAAQKKKGAAILKEFDWAGETMAAETQAQPETSPPSRATHKTARPRVTKTRRKKHG